MKSEAEIRAHRDAMRVCLEIPCGCAETGHRPECAAGGMMMGASIRVLDWILGEAPDYQRAVDRLGRGAAEAQRKTPSRQP